MKGRHGPWIDEDTPIVFADKIPDVVTAPAAELTMTEQHLLELLGKVHNEFTYVVGRGPSRMQDLTEVCNHVHALQNMVLAQTAARAYPDRYRLMGGVIE